MKSQQKVVHVIPPYKELPPFKGGKWACWGAAIGLIATAMVFEAIYSREHPGIGGAGSATAMVVMPMGAFICWSVGRILYDRKVGNGRS